jgi:hypothetical protein
VAEGQAPERIIIPENPVFAEVNRTPDPSPHIVVQERPHKVAGLLEEGQR